MGQLIVLFGYTIVDEGGFNMTMQTLDKFIYERTEYELNDIENLKTFFDIRSHGFFPFWPNTALRRGHMADYAVKTGGLLILQNLNVYHLERDKDNICIPLLNGKHPDEVEDVPIIGWDDLEAIGSPYHLAYIGVDLKIDNTGGILIERGFYEKTHIVKELRFENGVFTGENDYTEINRLLREKGKDIQDNDELYKAFPEWVEKAYKRYYESMYYWS